MENGLFSSDDFAEWSKKYVIYVHVSTHLEGREHEGLFRAKGFTGFPTLAFLDAEGGLTAKHAGRRAIPELDKTADKATAYLALRKKAASGDQTANQHLFVADLQLMRYDFTLGSLKFAGLREGMSQALRKKAEQRLVDVQYSELRGRLVQELQAGLDRQEYSKRYQALNVDFFRAGRLPGGRTAMSILAGVMRSAFQDKDEKLFTKALQEFKTRVATQPGYARWVSRYEDQLAELRENK